MMNIFVYRETLMRRAILSAAITAALLNSSPIFAASKTESIQQQLDALKKDYEQRIQALETRSPTSKHSASLSASSGNRSFNPAISLILDGRSGSFDNDPEDYELLGFALAGEAGLGEKGLSVGHSKLVMSANIDDKFYGKMTLALADHEGATEVELEEAFIQTLGLGNGLTLKAGRFSSEMGYLNKQHAHSWDFTDAPLIYRGLFGNRLIDDGMQITWVAPTDTFLQLGAEVLSGSRHPASGRHNGIGASTLFADIGGDIGTDHSWQLGLSHWQANGIEDRESGGHDAHGGGTAETPLFSGDSKINALDFVYKWAPNGNSKNQNFKFQAEYFDRKENGDIVMEGSDPEEATTYDGHQKGWYAQAIYQFKPQWRAGLRYDQLDSDNRGSDADVLSEAGLDNEGLKPKRTSVMIEWLPSEFSRVRLQYNRDESYENADNQVFLQYTMSLGSHGAHQF